MKVKPKDLASRLQAARRRRGMTQAELAKAAGLKQSTVSHFENGRRTPSIDNLLSLAEVLEVSVDYFLGLEPSPTSHGPASSELVELLERLPKRDVDLLLVLAREMARRQKET